MESSQHHPKKDADSKQNGTEEEAEGGGGKDLPPSSLLSRAKGYWDFFMGNLTVEPAFFLLWFSGGIAWGSGVTSKLDLWKACVVGMEFNDTVCDNIQEDEYDDYEDQVQIYINNFYLGYGYASTVPGIVIAVLAGSLSDRFGRKPLFIIPMVGWALWLVMYAIRLIFIRILPMEIAYLDLLTSMFGGGSIMYMAMYSIVTDITKPHERAKRLAFLDAVDYGSWFLGTLLSPYVFKQLGYAGIIVIRGIGLAAAILYSIFYLKETKPHVERKAKPKMNIKTRAKHIYRSYFVKSLKGFWHCLIKPRPGYLRFYFYLEMSLYVTYMFSGMYNSQTYLYLTKMFPTEFTLEAYALMNNYFTGLTVINLVFIMPLFLGKLRLNEVTISLINCCFCTLSLFLSAFARNLFPEYILAQSLTTLRYTQWSMLRTTITKTVGSDEVATVFSIMILCGELFPTVTDTLVKKVYNATLDIFPAAFFVMAACFYAFAVALNVTLFMVRGEIDENATEQQREKEEEEEEEKKEKEGEAETKL